MIEPPLDGHNVHLVTPGAQNRPDPPGSHILGIVLDNLSLRFICLEAAVNIRDLSSVLSCGRDRPKVCRLTASQWRDVQSYESPFQPLVDE